MASRTPLLLLVLAALALSACGIKGDLVRPKDIPEYEREKAQRRERAL